MTWWALSIARTLPLERPQERVARGKNRDDSDGLMGPMKSTPTAKEQSHAQVLITPPMLFASRAAQASIASAARAAAVDRGPTSHGPSAERWESGSCPYEPAAPR